MKKIFLFIFSFIMIFCVSCKNIEEVEVSHDKIDLQIAYLLQKMDENYTNETLKAISVVLRNNTIINNNSSSDFEEDINQKYKDIAQSTNNLVLKNENDDLIELSFKNNENYTWQKNIKKSELLEFALKNNISLSSISSVEPVSENEKIVGLKIGKKYFDYQTLAKHFDLQSNQITNISSQKDEILISGKNKGFYGYFDTQKSENLSKNNKNYKEILAEIFESLKLENYHC